MEDSALLVDELKSGGFEPKWKRVQTEADYRVGLEELPDLIISDYTIPQFGGLRAMELLRERGLDIPFILVSGSVGEEKVVEAMKHGATDYLLKDRVGRLCNAVESALEQKRLRDERGRMKQQLEERNIELERRIRLAALSADMGTALTHGNTLREILQRCSEALVQHLDAAFARIWTHNERENVLELQASAGMYTHIDGPHDRVPVGKFKIGLIAEERKPHLTNAVIGDPRVPEQEWARREGLVAFAGYPLIIGDRLVGVMAIFARCSLSQATLDAMASIADGLALGIKRKWSEQTLRDSEEKLRQMAENITDVFYMTSPDLQEMQYVSSAYEHIWGRSAARLYAHPQEWAEAILPEDRERVWTTFRGLEADESSVSVEFRISRPDGDVRWILSRGFQVRDAAGKVIRITSVASDITGRKRSEAELEQTHNQLLAVSRQAAMSEFATGVLHNVGNVLNSVNVASTCMADSLKKSKSADLAKVVALMREHEADLGTFFTHDPKGKQVPGYLAKLAERLTGEQAAALKELGELQKNVEHIKNIISVQQESSKMSHFPEALKLTDLAEDALKLNSNGLRRGGIQVSKDFEEIPPIMMEKH